MHDWSDNELDGMSREAADNYGPDRGMPNWDALQKQLDKELPEHKEDNRRRFFFLIFLCLILTGVTSYLLISQNRNTTNQNNQKISNDVLNSIKEKNNAGSLESEGKKNNASVIKDSDKIDVAPTLHEPDKSSASSTVGNKKTPNSLSLSANPQNNASNPFSARSKNPSNNKATKQSAGDEDLAITVESSDINKKKVSENKTTAPKSETAIGTAAAVSEADNAVTTEAQDAAKPETEKTAADQSTIAKDTIAADAGVKKAPTVKSPPKGSAFEVSLLAGIDASSVKFKYGDNAGFNAGLLLGYRFNKNWSVGTGLIYTRKNYTAAGSDFSPPKNYWTTAIKLDKVDGSCYMWEVPVYATYRFNSKRKSSGWFVGMGLSSYFMTKENYTYHYKYNNGNPATRHWENNDPSNYWFSILGISGGWEKNMGRGLSLGVAPYAKIPIQGVGFGDMSLSSYGLNLILTYRKATGRK